MSADPSKRELPKSVDARKLAGQGVTLSGVYTPDQLPRLRDAVVQLVQPVQLQLNFSIDEQGIRTISGEVSAEVEVTCQRCLGNMPLSLSAEVAIGLVWDEEGAQHLPKSLDPWIVGDEAADLSQLVEEELLLELPYVNYHDDGECEGASTFSTGEVEEETVPNPFQVLEQLKK